MYVAMNVCNICMLCTYYDEYYDKLMILFRIFGFAISWQIPVEKGLCFIYSFCIKKVI